MSRVGTERSRARKAIARLTVGLLLTFAFSALAQAPGEPIGPDSTDSSDGPLIAKLQKLRRAGKLLDKKHVAALLNEPQPAPITLLPPATQPLSRREIAVRARQSYVRIGWLLLCSHCNRWHLTLAGGYPISADGAVATCYHCIEPDEDVREEYLVAVDSNDNVLPVTSVLAAHKQLDAAILRVTGTFKPLALNTDVASGDPVYLYSDPLGTRGYFSSGIVNRFFWMRGRQTELSKLSAVQWLRLNVSTDWAPGSSGAAVLDAQGNAVGHVSVIASLRDEFAPDPDTASDLVAPPQPGATNDLHDLEAGAGEQMIILHEAVPARGVLLLAQSMNKQATNRLAVPRASAATNSVLSVPAAHH
jgi:hypothetical protein